MIMAMIMAMIMTDSNPFISVLMPTYNCGQFIEEAIKSILAQDYASLEIIVVDDGSTDDTQEIVGQIQSHCKLDPQSPSIHYFRKEHSGISSTRNFCIEKAQGKYIAWLDADDYWLPGKLHAQVKYLEEHPECQVLFTKYYDYIYKENQPDKICEFNKPLRFVTSLQKKEVFAKCGVFSEQLLIGSDTEMIYRLKIVGILYAVLDSIFYMRRLHGNNTTCLIKDAKMPAALLSLLNLRNNIQKNPFISVLIPTYNCGKFIKEAIESILIQNYASLEIIVVDDGSTDDTQEIVGQIQRDYGLDPQSPPIRYFRKEHSGISATRNLCLEKAQGKYIAWLDADDYWLPGKLHAQIAYLNEHPNCRIVFTSYEDFYDNDEVKNNAIAIRETEFSTHKDNRHHLTTTLAEKQVYEKCGLFNTALITGEDAEMVRKFSLNDFSWNHCVDKIYYRRRFHGNNITLLTGGVQYKLPSSIVLQSLMRNVQKNFSTDSGL
jgi:glycosyltransferase involved in cell wall biosynthesis